MLMRIATFSPEEHVTDLPAGVVTEGLLGTLKCISGFAGACFGLDRSSGRAISVTLWATLEELRSSEDAIAALACHGAQLANPKSVETFEVTYTA
jgi:hypothetical protein